MNQTYQHTHINKINSFVTTATYCAGIFSLMLLSLCETIVVMHLMEKDSREQGVRERQAALVEDPEGEQDKAASPSSPSSPRTCE